MASRGPAPKPAKLKIHTGKPGKRRASNPEPTPGAPRMPSWLSAKAKAEWRRLVPELKELGLLAVIDLAALASLCTAVAELEIATTMIEQEGRVIRCDVFNTNGKKISERLRPHPAVAQQSSALRAVKSFLSEFGLSPASRTRVHGGEGQAKDARESRFFGA